MKSIRISVAYKKEDLTVDRYEVNVLPCATVASIRDLLKLPTVEFSYGGYHLALKDTMESVESFSATILQVKLPRKRPSRGLKMAQWRQATERSAQSHTLLRISSGDTGVAVSLITSALQSSLRNSVVCHPLL